MRGIRNVAMTCACAWFLAVVAAAVAQPSPRGMAEMAYDSQSGVFVMFGGLTGPFDRAGSVIGGTWVFDPATGTWTERTPDPAPPALLAANLAYDAQSDRIVLWGGANASFQGNTDVWTYDVDADAWTMLDIDPATGPEHRAGSRMAYDASEDVVVMYGGQDTTNGSFPETTWLLDIDAPAWTQVETADHPPGRFFFGMAYEPSTERVYVWGGGAPILNTMWAFDASAGTWAELPATQPAPYPQGQLGMVAVPELGGLLVLGGEAQGSDAVWSFDVQAGTWSELGTVPFEVRNRFAIAHAPGYGTLLYGGQVGSQSFVFSDHTWLFDPATEEWRQP